MRKLLVIVFICCFGCLSEKNADPGVPGTFIKYYNGGFDDNAQDIKPTSDGGYILLATSDVKPDEVTPSRSKIKLIKTDEYGNLVWQKVYPEYDPDVNAEDPIDGYSFTGRSLAILRDGSGIESGYVIVGDSIQKGATSLSYLRIMLTDLDGNVTNARNIKPKDAEVRGAGVTINSNGDFVVLGSITSTQTPENMFLAELSPNLDSTWSRSFGAGVSTLANRLFIDANSFLYWSGTVTKENDKKDIRFVKTPLNSQNTFFDLPIGAPEFNETANDICNYGYGFAVIGTTDETTANDQDILFKRFTQDGVELATQKFGFPNQAENGLSICQAKDGGLILLGSVESNIEFGRGGKDYFLIKINAFGDTEWSQIFGSKNDDIGSKVLANADGSFTIFGTTTWGGLKTLALIKTNSEGNIE